MGRDGAPGVERGALESLLSGDGYQAAERDVLLRLLAAADAPALPRELAGEEAAVAAFRRRHTVQARRSGRRALLAKLLTVKVTAALAVTTLGGVAVAAATGTLPEIPGAAGLDARPAAPPPPATRAARPGNKQNKGPVVPVSPSGGPASTAAPSLTDLCRAFVTEVNGEPPRDRERARQQVLDRPTFAPLLTAAGGKGRAMPYCVRLLQAPGVGDTAPPGVSPTPGSTAGPGGPGQSRLKESPKPGKSHPPRHNKSVPPRNAGQSSP